MFLLNEQYDCNEIKIICDVKRRVFSLCLYLSLALSPSPWTTVTYWIIFNRLLQNLSPLSGQEADHRMKCPSFAFRTSSAGHLWKLRNGFSALAMTTPWGKRKMHIFPL